MAKSADAFRTISEVAEWLDTPAHVLRFWESRFTQIKPIKRAGGRRYYRPTDMLLLGGIKKLLHDDGVTIKAAQNILRESGIKHVQSLSQPVAVHVAIKKKSMKSVPVAPTAPEPTLTPEPDVSEQMDLRDAVAEIDAEEPTQIIEPNSQDSKVDLRDTTPLITDPNAPLAVIEMPENIRAVQDISANDLQDIEALYFSLKMVRNNMQRTTAGA